MIFMKIDKYLLLIYMPRVTTGTNYWMFCDDTWILFYSVLTPSKPMCRIPHGSSRARYPFHTDTDLGEYLKGGRFTMKQELRYMTKRCFQLGFDSSSCSGMIFQTSLFKALDVLGTRLSYLKGSLASYGISLSRFYALDIPPQSLPKWEQPLTRIWNVEDLVTTQLIVFPKVNHSHP